MDDLVVCDDATGVKCKFSFHFLFHVDNLVVCVDATGVKCKFSFHFLFRVDNWSLHYKFPPSKYIRISD